MDHEENDFIRVSTARNGRLLELSCLVGLSEQTDDIINVNENEILRRLNELEIQTLQGICKCQCSDWSKIRLILSKNNTHSDQSLDLKALVSETCLDGSVIFDMTDDEHLGLEQESPVSDWRRLPPGVHSNLLVCDSIFKLKSCRVFRNSFISRTYVGAESVLLNCGKVSASNCNYGKINISVGAESGGGRHLVLAAESTMIDVCRQLRGVYQTGLSSSIAQGVELNVLSNSCLIRNTDTVESVYMHERSSIQAATSVKKATLLPDSTIGSACIVSDALLQWNASIIDHSSVTEVLLMEQGHCGPNAIVASTVIGPDVHTSAGEIHASVIGPNTNSHHQSLLIGVLWPLGRGNVGYGANVGSNHTGRLPDQEAASGEGTFWGLSCVIKFPVDLTFSPYSIVAAGTTLPPQRICMPFSLIVGQPTGNEIIPGWVLQSSPYTLVRSEKKFATRRKAQRHDFYTGWKIFRPEVIDMCRWARKALVEGADGVKINGIGSNKLSDRAREIGVRAYKECIQRYALHGLLKWILQVTDVGNHPLDEKVLRYELLGKDSQKISSEDPSLTIQWPNFPWDLKDIEEWDFQRSLLLEEFPVDSNLSTWLEGLLKTLVRLEKDFARRIHKSKSRDDSRGKQTIPGYEQAHIAADKDPVIVEGQRMAEKIDLAVSELLGKLSSSTRSRL